MSMDYREPSEFEKERLPPHKEEENTLDKAVKVGIFVAMVIGLTTIFFLLGLKPPALP
jgi:hypothetical protein